MLKVANEVWPVSAEIAAIFYSSTSLSDCYCSYRPWPEPSRRHSHSPNSQSNLCFVHCSPRCYSNCCYSYCSSHAGLCFCRGVLRRSEPSACYQRSSFSARFSGRCYSHSLVPFCHVEYCCYHLLSWASFSYQHGTTLYRLELRKWADSAWPSLDYLLSIHCLMPLSCPWARQFCASKVLAQALQSPPPLQCTIWILYSFVSRDRYSVTHHYLYFFLWAHCQIPRFDPHFYIVAFWLNKHWRHQLFQRLTWCSLSGYLTWFFFLYLADLFLFLLVNFE